MVTSPGSHGFADSTPLEPLESSADTIATPYCRIANTTKTDPARLEARIYLKMLGPTAQRSARKILKILDF